MAAQETATGWDLRLQLTDDEIGLTALNDLIDKCNEWVQLSEQGPSGRKTRSANRLVDTLFDDIMNYKLPRIGPNPLVVSTGYKADKGKETNSGPQRQNSPQLSVEGDSESSGLGSSLGHQQQSSNTRTLRPRCRTPSRKAMTSPSTPTHRSLRAQLKKTTDIGTPNVLSAALNQQHPSVSCSKIRQLLRPDSQVKLSAQKKQAEEKERQERLMSDRKVKEERAEAQKKQLLEERAHNAKLKREQRLLHAAEVRKAREKAQTVQKLKASARDAPKDSTKDTPKDAPKDTLKDTFRDTSKDTHKDAPKIVPKEAPKEAPKDAPKEAPKEALKETKKIIKPAPHQEEFPKPHKLDETYNENQNNIDINVHDETTESQEPKSAVAAAWAKAPHLRDAIIAQFTKSEKQLIAEARRIFGQVKLPVELDKVFGPDQAVHNRYYCRTSSAVWSPHHRGLKRSSSTVLTPTAPKR